jgi:hypothetical protein
MAKRGRPLKAESRIDELAERQRELELAARDERLGSQLGRLRIQQIITYAEFLAGEAFMQLVEEYRRKIGLPKGQPKPNQLQPRIPGTIEREYTPEAIESVRERYDELYCAVIGEHGTKGLAIVYAVCVDDEWPAWWEQKLLKSSLGVIARILRY